MAKIQEIASAYGFESPPMREYTQADFPKIHARLERFWNDGIFNTARFLVDCGALTEKGAVIVENWRYEKNKAGESYGTCDTPRLKRAYKLLEWYLPESRCYPKIDVNAEMEKLKNRKRFEVRPLSDDENWKRADVPL
jgi:hypothetical protein